MNSKSSLFPQFTNAIQSIGIDVSKVKLDICFIDEDQKKHYYKIENSKSSLTEFVKKLKKHSVSKEIPIIIESTGDYHTLAAVIISNGGFDLKEINPILTKQFTKATIRGTKTDKIDACNLAQMGLFRKHELRSFDRSLEMIELSKRINLIHTLEKNITSLKASLKNFYDVSKNLGFKETKAIKAIKKTISTLAKEIKNLTKELDTHKFKDERDNEEVKKIASITGISSYMAMVCHIRFANKEFVSKEAMFAFIGLEPRTRTSGSSVNMKRSISKRGDKYVRKKLHQAAFCAVQHSKYFKSIYDRLKKNGKHHFTCLIAVEKKMVHIIWSMKKYNTSFNENYI